jgi:glycine betaine/proline transport system substrate-binding protein
MLNTMKKTLRKMAGVVALTAMAAAPISAHAEAKTIRIGWTAWSDAEAATNIAQQILEQRLHYHVKLVMTDIGLQYAGVSKGDLDLMLMAWLPTTHAAYWAKVHDKVEDLGTLYHGDLGWIVPAYVPASQVDSIADLEKPGMADKFGHKIQGIDAGSGLMQASAAAVKDYGLKDYDLVTASDAAMVAAVARAIHERKWIVATSWTPHWMFAKYQLRFLKDPKRALGETQHIDAVGRMGFTQAFPRAAAFIKDFKIPLPDLQAVMMQGQKTSFKEAAADYIKTHPQMVAQWLRDVKPAAQ